MSYSKYKAIKTTIDNIKFDSKKEANRYCELKLLLLAKEISDLQMQVKYELLPKQKDERAINYIADFVYKENGKTIVEDVKGFCTNEYILKRKMLKYFYKDINFIEIK